MSHFILDEQLAVNEVLGPLQKRLKIQRLVELLPEDDQDQVPKLLFQSLKLEQFKTRARRMGKVVRVAKTLIQYWESGSNSLHIVS